MTGIELENFYKADDRRYILCENQDFINWNYDMKKNFGFTPIIERNDIQDLINQVVMFYEFKYPNEMFASFRHKFNVDENKNTIKIADMLGFEQLKFRLYHDYVQFLECNYWNYINLKKSRKKMWDLTDIWIRIYPNGEIEPVDLEKLKEYQFLYDISGISRIEDLYGRFESIDTDVDYSELTKCIQQHKYNLTLRNNVLSLIPYALVYSENSLPQDGYVRAKSFVRTFNKEYNLKMNLDELDEIMSRDYSGKQHCLIKTR